MKRKIKRGLLVLSIFSLCILSFQEKAVKQGENIIDIWTENGEEERILIPSKPSGYYEKPFELTFVVPDDMEVFYTIDCSSPTQESMHYDGKISITDALKCENVWTNKIVSKAMDDYEEQRYVEPNYKVDKATVIRAALFDEEVKVGKDFIFIYFVGIPHKEIYQMLPIVSLVCEAQDLFDEEKGIYTNYGMRGRSAERLACVDYFLPDFCWQFSDYMGIRIRGGASREKVQKGFNLFARTEYESNAVDMGFCANDSVISWSLVTQYDDVKIKDALTYHMSDVLQIGRKECFPCNVFLNGEYWGMYYIAERFDEDYFVRHYQVDNDNVIVIKDGDLERGGAGDERYYEDLINLVQGQDMALEDSFNLFTDLVDIESLIDYYCLEAYVYNQDWPNHNRALWRTRIEQSNSEYADTKWRFLLYDTNYQEAMNAHSGHDSAFELLFADEMIPHLLKNEMFCQMLATRMCDIANIVAETYRMDALIEKLGQEIKGSVMLSEHRFYGVEHYDVTKKLSEDMMHFFYLRPEFIREEVRSVLYPDCTMANLVIVLEDVEQGTVQVNGLNIDLAAGSWQGEYIEGLEVTLQATAAEGYEFLGWKNVSKDTGNDIDLNSTETRLIIPQNTVVIKAVFADAE